MTNKDTFEEYLRKYKDKNFYFTLKKPGLLEPNKKKRRLFQFSSFRDLDELNMTLRLTWAFSVDNKILASDLKSSDEISKLTRIINHYNGPIEKGGVRIYAPLRNGSLIQEINYDFLTCNLRCNETKTGIEEKVNFIDILGKVTYPAIAEQTILGYFKDLERKRGEKCKTKY